MKHLFLLICICTLIVMTGCDTLLAILLEDDGGSGTSEPSSTRTERRRSEPTPETGSTGPQTDERARLLREAENYIGVRYSSPPNTPSSFDCSSFVSYVYSKFGYTLPRATSSYSSVGTKIDFKNAQPGDIIVFSNVKGTNRVDHVAILYQKSKSGNLVGSWLIHAASINTGTSMIKGNQSTKTGVVITELGLRGDGRVDDEYFYQRYMYTTKVLK